jgi:hypothetical protein
MTRFFFDMTTTEQSLFDYKGHEFGSPRSAHDFAEAIVHDLKTSLTTNWDGWSVEVLNAHGKKFFSLPIDRHELKAA